MSDAPQCLILGGRRRGRPPLSRVEASAPVNVRLPESDYDLAYQMAARRGVSVPEILRQGFRRLLADERGGVLRYQK